MLKFGTKNDSAVSYKFTVRLLEDTEVIEDSFQAHHKGKYLLELVCRQLNLIEKDYFGLRYVDSNKQRHWLDPGKTILKQVKEMEPIIFSFRVKFYPPDPFRLKEEITRYQIFLQLRRDLLHGRLYCAASEAALLGAYLIQGDLGDYDPEEHQGNYITEHKLLLKQTLKIEEDIIELHQTQMRGQSPETTETNFLRKACQLDTYGIDPQPVKDHRGNQLYLGINHSGIITLQGSRKTHHFRWNEVQKINYEGKMFIIHLSYNEDPRTKKKHTVGFKCSTSAACRHVWRCAVEQMLFFTLPSSSEAPSVVTGGSFFSWGTKFRYSGRTEREILEDIGPLRRDEPMIKRTSSLRRKASSVPATPSTPIGTELGDIRYGSLPRSNHSAPDTRIDGLTGIELASAYCQDSSALPLLETVAEDQELTSRPRDDENINVHVTTELMCEHVNSNSIDIKLIKIEEEIITTEEFIKTNSIDDTSSVPGYGEYYFRDSFDQTENQPMDGETAQLITSGGGTQKTKTTPLKSSNPRRFNLLRVFIPTFLLVALILTTLLIYILESETELFNNIKNLPEMIILRQEYYEPAKDYMRQKFGNFN